MIYTCTLVMKYTPGYNEESKENKGRKEQTEETDLNENDSDTHEHIYLENTHSVSIISGKQKKAILKRFVFLVIGLSM